MEENNYKVNFGATVVYFVLYIYVFRFVFNIMVDYLLSFTEGMLEALRYSKDSNMVLLGIIVFGAFAMCITPIAALAPVIRKLIIGIRPKDILSVNQAILWLGVFYLLEVLVMDLVILRADITLAETFSDIAVCGYFMLLYLYYYCKDTLKSNQSMEAQVDINAD